MDRVEPTGFRAFCFLICAACALFGVLVGLAVLAPVQVQVMACAVIVGCCIGSFSNVVIWRLPIMLARSPDDFSTVGCRDAAADEGGAVYVGSSAPLGRTTLSLAKPASVCPKCEKKIECWHNVPIFSFLWLRGRCASCSSPISFRYPAIEATFALVYGVLAWHYGFSFALVGYAVLFSGLAVLFMIDRDAQLLPDALTQPLLWLGLLANFYGLHTSLENAVWGAVSGYTIFRLIAAAFKAWTGKEGMGQGDFKLMGVLGAWLGWHSLPWIMWIAAGLSILQISASVLMRRKGWGDRQAFGPAIILAGLVVALITESGIYAFGFE